MPFFQYFPCALPILGCATLIVVTLLTMSRMASRLVFRELYTYNSLSQRSLLLSLTLSLKQQYGTMCTNKITNRPFSQFYSCNEVSDIHSSVAKIATLRPIFSSLYQTQSLLRGDIDVVPISYQAQTITTHRQPHLLMHYPMNDIMYTMM